MRRRRVGETTRVQRESMAQGFATPVPGIAVDDSAAGKSRAA
jgi:hypothetical protein